MLIEEKKLNHWIEHYYGYGSWDARIWLIDLDESGGDLPEDVADKINYFYRAHPTPGPTLCDIREMYRHSLIHFDSTKAASFPNRYEYRFGQSAVLHGVWKNLITFVHAYRGEKLPDLLDYQKETFASPESKQEAWLHLYPLPQPHNHGWYYSWLDLPNVRFLKSRALYQAHMYKQRIETILSSIHTHKPQLVLMYGMENINMLKESVQESFPGTKFKMIKAIKQQIPQSHQADLNGTMLVITTQIPALRHRRVETGFDWEAFGRALGGRWGVSGNR